jgi:uncharacterized protein YbbC (DUF1343 family)/CubicO group peptidase (beta-lactamase class C family)
MKLFWCSLFASTLLCAQTFSGGPAEDQAIQEAIKQGRLPGAVLLIGHEDQVVYRKAYGNRSEVPKVEAMTADTIFDVASLTKVIATTTSLMKLYEQGKFRLNDKITDYLPEFQGGKSDITIRQLFTHFSGLAPDVPLVPVWSGYETGMRLAYTDKPAGPAGVRFVYSDINFELLGELVHRLSGMLVSDYAREQIFQPLAMKETTFQPPAAWIPRIAPTERQGKEGPPLRGVVHDPTARYMGGVAGHAGLFSTADDLSRFCRMMIGGGELDGVRIVSPLTIKKFTEPQTPADQPILRGLGWDMDSPYSTNRGELFPLGSFGHTGFTGTSVWIDPVTRSYVILLANSVHPTARPSIVALRSRVATIAAAGLGVTVQGVALTGYNETIAGAGQRREINGRSGATRTGLDVLAAQKFSPFAGKRIGLITNQTGVDLQGRRNIDLMQQAGIKIGALFSPEHGFAGALDRPGIEDTVDFKTDIKVYSLYGKTLRPTPEMLQGLDALVFDIQDVGARFYTYESTMAYALEAAAKAGLPFFVLDRPNPITGTHVEGPLLDAANKSFVGSFAGLPTRHGMTMGELAKMFNVENKWGANLTVIQMQDWNRGDWFDSTGLPWVNPSPNMRSLSAAILYPGLCFLESSKNYSEGRGTDSPFEQTGADFVVGRDLAAYLNKRLIPGVHIYPTSFTPTDSNFKGVRIEGVRYEITNRDIFDSTRLGLEVALANQKLYPGKLDYTLGKRLIGSEDGIRRIQAGEDPRTIQASWQDAMSDFLKIREKYLLY